LTAAGAGWDLPLEAASFAPVLASCLSMDHSTYLRLSASAADFGKMHAQDPATIDLNYGLFEK
jgi:hypothetical protein